LSSRKWRTRRPLQNFSLLLHFCPESQLFRSLSYGPCTLVRASFLLRLSCIFSRLDLSAWGSRSLSVFATRESFHIVLVRGKRTAREAYRQYVFVLSILSEIPKRGRRKGPGTSSFRRRTRTDFVFLHPPSPPASVWVPTRTRSPTPSPRDESSRRDEDDEPAEVSKCNLVHVVDDDYACFPPICEHLWVLKGPGNSPDVF